MVNPQTGTPVLVRDVATVTFGPDIRRGVSELDGRGEVVGGVVIMRFGENAQKVIERVKAKIAEIEPTLPKGLKIVPTYDRSDLIDRSVDNLKHTLIEELIIVSLVILVFLWHFPSAIIPIITIPLTVILAFIPIQMSGMTANIMSLGGIAVAIGAMVDAAVVVVEQTHKKLEHWEAEGRPGSLPRGVHLGRQGSRRAELLRAAGDRCLLPAGVHAGSSGRPAVQAAGVHQELRHGHCRGAGHHARSRPCGCCSPAWTDFQLPPEWLARDRQRPCWSARFTAKTTTPSAVR